MDIEVLVLVRKSPNATLPSNKSAVECRYGNATIAPTALHLYSHRVAILCPAPPEEHPWNMHSISIAVPGQDEEIHPRSPFAGGPWTGSHAPNWRTKLSSPGATW